MIQPVRAALAAFQSGNAPHAQRLLRQAIAEVPSDADAVNLAGMISLEPSNGERLPASLARSLAIAPHEPEFHYNLGHAALSLGRLGQASAALKSALALRPDFADGHLELGNHAARHGDYELAATGYGRAIALAPAHIGAHVNLGWARLALGQFYRGFRDYGWRWREPRFAALRTGLVGEPWDGRPFVGRLLVFAEQGFGDTLQFCRLVTLAAARAGRVVLEAQPELVGLVRRSLEPIEVVARAPGFPSTGRPRHDRHAALLDLPLLLQLELESLPAAQIPYLRADPAKQQRWRRMLNEQAPGCRRIGLVWAGNPRAGDPAAAAVDRRRSIPLAMLAPLGRLPNLAFISLQTGGAVTERSPAGFPLVDLSRHLVDFDETAAAVAELDLVVTVDTAVAHLAGGLGRPVWVLSRADGCWRWLTERDDSPWYPTLRLFRQRTPGDWSGTISALECALASFVATAGR